MTIKQDIQPSEASITQRLTNVTISYITQVSALSKKATIGMTVYLIHEFMRESDSLRLVLDGSAIDDSVLESLNDAFMNRFALRRYHKLEAIPQVDISDDIDKLTKSSTV